MKSYIRLYAKGYRRLQEVTGGYRRLQEVTGGYRRLQAKRKII